VGLVEAAGSGGVVVLPSPDEEDQNNGLPEEEQFSNARFWQSMATSHIACRCILFDPARIASDRVGYSCFIDRGLEIYDLGANSVRSGAQGQNLENLIKGDTKRTCRIRSLQVVASMIEKRTALVERHSREGANRPVGEIKRYNCN
jgi:hypothetical protein